MTIPNGFTPVDNNDIRRRDPRMRMRGYADSIAFSAACHSLPDRISFATNEDTGSLYIYADPEGRKRTGYMGGASHLGHKEMVLWIKKHWGNQWAILTPYADGWIAKVPTND